MRNIPTEVVSYNRVVSENLRNVFTPLCEELNQHVTNLSAEEIQTYLNNLTIAQVDYQSSKFDIYQQSAPEIENDVVLTSGKKTQLTENEKHYFQSFLKHLNETAVLKPYNLSELLVGKFSNYLWAPVKADQKEANNHAADTTVIPIGEYGIDNSVLMLLTTTILLRMTDKLKESALKAEIEHWPLLAEETLRGRKKAEKMSAIEQHAIISTIDTLQEGIQSFQATLSSLTAKKINNLSFDELLAHIINENAPQRIAVKVPFSYTLPSIRQGIFFNETFDLANGSLEKLSFSNAFNEYCKATQDMYRSSRLVVDGKRNPGLLGSGCPIAQKLRGHEFIGINAVGMAYLHLYNYLKQNLTVKNYLAQIHQLQLSTPKPLQNPLEKPNECKVYNVNPEARAIAKEKVSEMIELQDLTNEVLKFWFGQLPINKMPSQEMRDRWFNADSSFDETIRNKFGKYIDEINNGKFLQCNRTAAQSLALIIILDQFSRNIYRGNKKSYASDELSTKIALDMIKAEQDLALAPVCRWFVYMPLQHSEDKAIQDKSVAMFSKLDEENRGTENEAVFAETLKYAKEHSDAIQKFGRFPYRNSVLGRSSTQEELQFLSAAHDRASQNKNGLTSHQSTPRENPIQTNIKSAINSVDKTDLLSTMLMMGLGAYAKNSDESYKVQIACILIIMLGMYMLSNKISSGAKNFYNSGLGFFQKANAVKKEQVMEENVNKLKSVSADKQPINVIPQIENTRFAL